MLGDAIDHVGMQCRDIAASTEFYAAVLAPLGGHRIMEYGPVIGHGTDFPIF